jgi:hypothetical protein
MQEGPIGGRITVQLVRMTVNAAVQYSIELHNFVEFRPLCHQLLRHRGQSHAAKKHKGVRCVHGLLRIREVE